MSTRASSRKRNRHPELVTRDHEIPRQQLVDIYRSNSMRTIRDIRKGIVNEEDVDKLQNFMQVAVALMQRVSVETFRQAQRDAEIGGFLGGRETSVVLDPRKQAAVVDGEPVYPLGQLVADVHEVSTINTFVDHAPDEVLEHITQNLDQIFTTPHVEPKD